MLFQNFGPFLGKHVINWEHGPEFWHISGRNLVEPRLGGNGAGKTTIITALYWCLTGRTLRNSRPAERVEPWSASGTTSVELGLIVNGEKHKLVRSRKPSKLMLDDEPTTDEALAALLPAPEVMLYTFILGQHATMFLDLKPEPQAQLFNDLLDLDVWLDAAALAGTAVKAADTVLSTLNNQTAALTGRLEEVVANEESYEALEREYEDTKKTELRKNSEAMAALEASLAEAQAALAAIPNAVVDLKSLVEARGQASEYSRKWQDISSGTWGKYQAALQRVEQFDEALQSTKLGTCPTCGQKLPKGSHLHGDRTESRDALEAAAETLLVQRNEEYAQSTEWINRMRELDQDIDAARETEMVRQRQDSVCQNDIAHLENELVRCRQRAAEFDKENPYTASLVTLRSRKQSIEAELSAVAEKRERETRVHDTAALWQDAFRAIRLSIIEDTLVEVSMAANKHAERLGLSGWQIEFATERETKRGTTTLGFTTLLYPPNIETPIPWDSYSGGESQRWQLATAFGLGEVLLARAGISPNIELIDEPTRGLSPEGISDLLECLAERAKETGRTIWLVDHHSLQTGDFDGILTVQKTEDGSSIIQ